MNRNAVIGVVATVVLAAAACQQPVQKAEVSPVERGKYLVTIAGCNDCHTPWKMGENGPEPDMTRMLSGHPASLDLPPAPVAEGGWMAIGSATMTAWAGPWGVSYAANLTPDEETGIGAWDQQVFVKSMRSGQHLGAGRPILPPMPWPNLAKASDEDLAAIFAYLKSIPAINNQVPEAVVAMPPAAGE